MNIKAFKRLIKEAVSEAIYEQLPEILEEVSKQQNKQSINENKTFSFNSGDASSLPVDIKRGLAAKMGIKFDDGIKTQHKQNDGDFEQKISLDEFILDAARNMTPQEMSGLKNLS